MTKRYLCGAGNYTMGDDGVGLRLIEEIVSRNLEEGFVAIDLAGGKLNLIDYLAPGVEKIVLIDCVRAGKTPGDCFFFSPSEVASEKELGNISTHEEDLLKTLALAKGMDYPVPPIRVMGIEPVSMVAGSGLSDVLVARFEDYIQAAIEEVMG